MSFIAFCECLLHLDIDCLCFYHSASMHRFIHNILLWLDFFTVINWTCKVTVVICFGVCFLLLYVPQTDKDILKTHSFFVLIFLHIYFLVIFVQLIIILIEFRQDSFHSVCLLYCLAAQCTLDMIKTTSSLSLFT